MDKKLVRRIQILEEFGYNDMWKFLDNIETKDIVEYGKKKQLRKNVTLSLSDYEQLKDIFVKRYGVQNYKWTTCIRMLVKLFILMENKKGERNYFR